MSDIVSLETHVDLFGDETHAKASLDRASLASALHATLKDISIDEFAHFLTNEFECVVEYAKLCAGEQAGQRISLLFNPHRLDISTVHRPDSLFAVLKKANWCDNLA